MAIYKNKASQKLAVFAYDSTTGAAQTGDAANISAQISLDGAATAATNDAAPTELDANDAPGVYLFDMTQAETNADLLVLAAVSSTDNILLEPLLVYTQPEVRTANLTQIAGNGTNATNLGTAAGNYSATRGLAGTALPAAAADAAGGLPISDAGELDLDAKLAETNEVTAARMAALTDWINGGRLDLLIDAIKASTDNLPASPAAVSDIPTTAQIEAALINEGDGQQLIDAILQVINSSLDLPALELTAIGQAVRTELATELGRIDAAITTRLAAAGYTAPDNASAVAAAASAASIDGKLTAARAGYLDALNVSGTLAHSDTAATYRADLSAAQAILDKLNQTLEDNGGTHRFTVAALAQAPSGGGGGSTINVGAIASTVQSGEVESGPTLLYQHEGLTRTWGIVDEDGAAIDIDGLDTLFVAHDRDTPTPVGTLFEIVGTGASSNAAFAFDGSTHTAASFDGYYTILINPDSDATRKVVAHGRLTIQAGPKEHPDP